MSPSPFHGIFSAFNQEHGSSSPSGSAPETPASGTVQPQQTGNMQRSKQVGQIAVDIYEMDNYYIIRAPIAGVKLSDIEIEVDDKVLTIHGRRTVADDVPSDQYYLRECFWGEFSRSITLPCPIDPRKVKATFSKDCILKVLIPKEEKVKIVRVNEG